MPLSEYKIIDKVLDVPMKSQEKQGFLMGAYITWHNNLSVEHALIYKGNIIKPSKPILFRINSACYTGDIFGCQRCDCHWQLQEAMHMLDKHGGLIIYHFHHEGKGFGFTNKLKAIDMHEKQGKSPSEAALEMHDEIDHRKYYSAVKILQDLKINQVKLITNNPIKQKMLQSGGINVTQRVPIVSTAEHLKEFLSTKKKLFGNFIDDNLTNKNQLDHD